MIEKELLDGCLRGHKKYQKALYDYYAEGMLGVCYRYADSIEEAEDFLQEGFVIVFQKLNTLKEPKALGGWIKRIMVNTALQALRKKKVFVTDHIFADIEIESDEPIDEKSTADELMAAMHELAPGHRAVLNLYAIEGYSHREIAELLDMSESTSRSQYFKAKKKLINLLNKKHVREKTPKT